MLTVVSFWVFLSELRVIFSAMPDIVSMNETNIEFASSDFRTFVLCLRVAHPGGGQHGHEQGTGNANLMWQRSEAVECPAPSVGGTPPAWSFPSTVAPVSQATTTYAFPGSTSIVPLPFRLVHTQGRTHTRVCANTIQNDHNFGALSFSAVLCHSHQIL